MVIVQLILVLFLGIYIYSNYSSIDKLTLLVFGFKLLIGLFFVYLYQNYYAGDLENYISLAENWQTKSSFFETLIYNEGIEIDAYKMPRYLFFAKLFYVFYVISFCNIWLTSIVFTLVTFMFFYETVKIVNTIFPDLKVSYLLTSLVPSVLFWSSGLVKETICFPAFLILIFTSYLVYQKQFNWKLIPIVLLSIVLILKLRYFYVPLCIVFVFTFLIQKLHSKIYFWVGLVSCVILYFDFQEKLILQLQFQYFQHLVYDNYWTLSNRSAEGSFISLSFEDKSMLSVLWAFIQSFKGMFFMSFKNIWLSIVSIENLFVLLGLIYSAFTLQQKKRNAEVIALIVFVIVSSGFFQLVSPNYGSLSRYRIVHWFFLNWIIVYSLSSRFMKTNAIFQDK